jgi:hypothetical protein
MGIDHRRFLIFVTEKLLDRSDIITSSAVMAGEQGYAEAVRKFRLCGGRRRMARVLSNWIQRDWYGVSHWHGPPSSCVGTRRDYHLFLRKVKLVVGLLLGIFRSPQGNTLAIPPEKR